VIGEAFAGVTQDAAVLNFDRRQRYTFNKSFEQYVSTRVGAGRINGGRAMLQRNAALLSRIEAKFGVPRQIWSRSGGWKPISARATWASCR
jgi:membrane-bound lytic murein transglycosylase B